MTAFPFFFFKYSPPGRAKTTAKAKAKMGASREKQEKQRQRQRHRLSKGQWPDWWSQSGDAGGGPLTGAGAVNRKIAPLACPPRLTGCRSVWLARQHQAFALPGGHASGPVFRFSGPAPVRGPPPASLVPLHGTSHRLLLSLCPCLGFCFCLRQDRAYLSPASPGRDKHSRSLCLCPCP